MSAARLSLALAVVASLLAANCALAQPAPARPTPPASPREAAPIDLTGQWVAIVNEDWRWRMVTPPKGDYASVPLNDEGRRVADQWDVSQDGRCEAYGAGALLRMPTRLRIRWDGAERLVLETDAGRQIRNFVFGAQAPPGARSLQGQSAARWMTPLTSRHSCSRAVAVIPSPSLRRSPTIGETRDELLFHGVHLLSYQAQ